MVRTSSLGATGKGVSAFCMVARTSGYSLRVCLKVKGTTVSQCSHEACPWKTYVIPKRCHAPLGKHWSGAPCAPGDPSYTVSGHSWILPVSPTSYFSCCGSEQRTKLMGEQSEWDLRRQNTVLLFSFDSFCSCFIFPHLSWGMTDQ